MDTWLSVSLGEYQPVGVREEKVIKDRGLNHKQDTQLKGAKLTYSYKCEDRMRGYCAKSNCAKSLELLGFACVLMEYSSHLLEGKN